MGTSEDIVALLTGGARAIVISEKDVDLRPSSGDNRLFILKVGEGSSAAGGRGGGFGERKVVAASCYELRGGEWRTLFQADGEGASAYEVPYHVSRLPMTMGDGSESVGYGVVEPGLVHELMERAGVGSPA